MKIADSVKRDTNLEERPIGVDPKVLGKIIGMLSKSIYTSPASAFREAWLNARESVALAANMAGVDDSQQGQDYCRPTEITLPRPDRHINPLLTTNIHAEDKEPRTIGKHIIIPTQSKSLDFSIRDYGVGLSPEELENMISNAGSSMKTDTDEYGGGMGIGSLSGFKVADQIVYTAYKNGVASTIILSSESNSWSPIKPTPTDEPDGVLLTYRLRDDKTAESFAEGALDFLSFAPDDERTVLICSPYQSNYLRTTFNNNTGKRGHHGLDSFFSYPNIIASFNCIHIRIDGCIYKGVTSNGNTLEMFFRKVFSRLNSSLTMSAPPLLHLIWDVPVGYFNASSITPNRENVILTETDLDNLAELYINRHPVLEQVKNAKESIDNILHSSSHQHEAIKSLIMMTKIMDTLQKHYDSNGIGFPTRANDPHHVMNTTMSILDNCITEHNKNSHIKLHRGRLSVAGDSHIEINNNIHVPNNKYKAAYYTYAMEDGTTSILQTDILKEGKLIIKPVLEKPESVAHIYSTSHILNTKTWNEKIQKLPSNPPSLSDYHSDILDKVTDTENILASTPLVDQITSEMQRHGFIVGNDFAHNIDGLELRKLYQKLVGTKSKKTTVKYNVHTQGSVATMDLSDIKDHVEDNDSEVYVYTGSIGNPAEIKYNLKDVSVVDGLNALEYTKLLAKYTHPDKDILIIHLQNTSQSMKSMVDRIEKFATVHKTSEIHLYDFLDDITLSEKELKQLFLACHGEKIYQTSVPSTIEYLIRNGFDIDSYPQIDIMDSILYESSHYRSIYSFSKDIWNVKKFFDTLPGEDTEGFFMNRLGAKNHDFNVVERTVQIFSPLLMKKYLRHKDCVRNFTEVYKVVQEEELELS